jgi:hypothetical protein
MLFRWARLWCADVKGLAGFLVVLVVLLAFYLPTLQTIPNGADHYYMRDVGETQVVLNTWGTLHATGYPLYVMTGNLLVILMRAMGIMPATAPALVSLLWSIIALALIFALALHLTGRLLPTMAVTLLFGLTRTVWIHAVIAEIYSFGLAILALLYLLALWRRYIPQRIYWLALAGGIGVFHHRALALIAPALIYAVWPELMAARRKLARIVPLSIALGLVGFLPYLYLPLRAQSGSNWVYGEPGTWAGFWDEFTGREAEQYVGLPESWDDLLANFNAVNTVLVKDLTLPGIALGIMGLSAGLRHPLHRRAAMTFVIGGLTAYAFHVALYSDILSALILPICMSIAFGWLFLADWLFSKVVGATWQVAPTGAALVVVGVVGFTCQNQPFITELTGNTTGLDTIALVQHAPPGSTLMLAWGVRHHAVGFARDVMGELQHLRLVDHKADFQQIVADGMLVTPEYTFYNHPVGWWEERLGTRAYLRAVAPYLVQIDRQPERVEGVSDGDEINVLEHRVQCHADSIVLEVAWYAPSRPEHDLSVFVHLLDGSGNLIGQGDQSAPVYGWRPLTTWEAGEVVRDVYVLPNAHNAATVRYGLYHQLAGGTFENVLEQAVQMDCRDE